VARTFRTRRSHGEFQARQCRFQSLPILERPHKLANCQCRACRVLALPGTLKSSTHFSGSIGQR